MDNVEKDLNDLTQKFNKFKKQYEDDMSNLMLDNFNVEIFNKQLSNYFQVNPVLLWSNSLGLGVNGQMSIPNVGRFTVFKAVVVNASGSGSGGDIILTKANSNALLTGGCLYLSPSENRLYTYYLTITLSGIAATVKYVGISSLIPIGTVNNTFKVTQIWGLC